jgi:hypothetical protein
VTVVTFREDLYDGFAVDLAAKTYARFATFDLEKADGFYRVGITATGRFEESKIALEFQNFALGATIERLKATMKV